MVEEEPAVIADVMPTLGSTKLNADGKLDCFLTCIAHDHKSGGDLLAETQVFLNRAHLPAQVIDLFSDAL